METYKTVPIDSLTPDPDQPRKYFDEDALKGMITSIRNEGLINAIEVDEKFMIITGERRWRAAKRAGLAEVPVKILPNLTPSKRFVRQVQENIHQNTMSSLDTAEALEKVRKNLPNSAAEFGRDKSHSAEYFQKGIKELAEIFGISEPTIGDYLALLKEKGKMKEALKDPKFQMSKVATLNREVPEKYKEKMRDVVATQKSIPRDTVRHMASALRRAEKYDEEGKAEKLLQFDFQGMKTVEALRHINKIIPDEASRVKEPADAMRMVSEKIIEFMDIMEKYPLESFDDFHRPMLTEDLKRFGGFIASYLGLKKSNLVLSEKKES